MAEILNQVKGGELKGRHYVWHDGIEDWARVRTVPRLAAALPYAASKEHEVKEAAFRLDLQNRRAVRFKEAAFRLEQLNRRAEEAALGPSTGELNTGGLGNQEAPHTEELPYRGRRLPRYRAGENEHSYNVAPKRIFVSWTDASDTPRESVHDFVAGLRANGFEVRVDLDHWPRVESWTDWMQAELKAAEVVLVLCSQTYRTRFENNRPAPRGRGVAFEGALITQELYDACGYNERFIPVLFPGVEDEAIPTVLRRYRFFRLGEDDGALLERIRGEAGSAGESKKQSSFPRGASALWPEPPEPTFADEASKRQAEHLMALEKTKKGLLTRGENVQEIADKIRALKRKLREGPELLAGDILGDGQYRLLDKLGCGGFAQVWQAVDLERKRTVALKLLHGQYIRDQTRVERFFRGAQRMALLQDPRVVRVLDERRDDGGHLYFVMECLEGGDLQKAVGRGCLDLNSSLGIIIEAGRGLMSAHAAGLVHRDVKPANILLSRDLFPKITDFDLVWALDSSGGTRTGAMGTYRYAAPECLEDASRVDGRADVYSLALTCLFLLSGKPPSLKASGIDALDQQAPSWLPTTQGRTRDSGASLRMHDHPLYPVLRKGLATHPLDRFESMEAFVDALSLARDALRAGPQAGERKVSWSRFVPRWLTGPLTG